MKFKRIYIWYSIPVFFILIWILFVFMPLSSMIKSKEKELRLLKNEQASLDAKINVLSQQKNQRDKTVGLLKEYISDIPVIESFPDYIKSIIKASNKYGVAIINFNSTFSSIDNLSKSILLTPSFDVTIKGRFMDISTFLERLTEYRAYRAIKKAELSYNEKEYPILTGRFVIEFKSWRRSPRFESK